MIQHLFPILAYPSYRCMNKICTHQWLERSCYFYIDIHQNILHMPIERFWFLQKDHHKVKWIGSINSSNESQNLFAPLKSKLIHFYNLFELKRYSQTNFSRSMRLNLLKLEEEELDSTPFCPFEASPKGTVWEYLQSRSGEDEIWLKDEQFKIKCIR